MFKIPCYCQNLLESVFMYPTFFVSETESLSVYRIYAKSEEVNEIKAEFNLGVFLTFT